MLGFGGIREVPRLRVAPYSLAGGATELKGANDERQGLQKLLWRRVGTAF